MAKENEKKLLDDYKKAQKRIRELEPASQKLITTETALEKAKEEISAEKQKMSDLETRYSDLLKKCQALEKAAEGYADPKDLKEKLRSAEDLVSEKEKRIQELNKMITLANQKSQDLLFKGGLSLESMQQVQEKEKEIDRLKNELASAKKKMAKYEGDFRFPAGCAVLLSVPMGDGKVAEAALYSPKQPAGAPSVIIEAITQGGKALSVNFKKA